MKRAIITGATGAIGTALIKRLTENGVEVLILHRRDSARLDNIINAVGSSVTRADIDESDDFIILSDLVTIKYCALSELAALENDTGKSYDVFYHLAWAGAAGPGRHDQYLQNQNVTYALDAVGAAKRFGCRLFVGAGSQAEYGRYEGLLNADVPVRPEMGYGYAKLCAGYMTRDYAHQLGLEHVWVRILSVYGPNDGKQSMIMSTIDKLTKGERPQFTPGEQLWDYLYSFDAADALIAVGDRGIDGKTYVLGSGNARPLKEYIEILRDSVRPEAELGIGEVPYGPKQVMHLCADITELTKDTGWSAKTSFEDGIRKTIASSVTE